MTLRTAPRKAFALNKKGVLKEIDLSQFSLKNLLRRVSVCSHRRNKEIKINIHLCSINRTTRNILFLCFRDKTSPNVMIKASFAG